LIDATGCTDVFLFFLRATYAANRTPAATSHKKYIQVLPISIVIGTWVDDLYGRFEVPLINSVQA